MRASSRRHLVHRATSHERGGETEAVELRVTVLGAGLAGLRAGQILGEAGCEVTVLEGRSEVGGRLMTLGSPLSGGLQAEVGAARFPPDFVRLNRLARNFELDVAPFYPETGTMVRYAGGVRDGQYEPDDRDLWGYEPRSEAPPLGEAPSPPLWVKLRQLLPRLRGRRPWRMYRIRAGMQRLAEALATDLRGEVRQGTEVLGLDCTGDGVRVEVQGPHGPEWLESDAAVCALPLPKLASLRVAPELPAHLTEAATSVPQRSAVRLFFELQRPFWRDHGHNGFAVTDTLGEVWAPYFDTPREPTVLVAYAKGERADRWAALPPTGRHEQALHELDRVFPGAEAHARWVHSFVWKEHPWSRGAWPMGRDGHVSELARFREPWRDRVYFAGDYAARERWLNMTEGALESAEHTARQILRIHRRPGL